jgi:hypothetical protein
MSEATVDPTGLLAEVQALRARSRRLAHDGAWLPALVLAALPLLSIVLYAYPVSSARKGLVQYPVQYPYWAGLPWQQRSSLASYAFWLVAEPLAFVVVALWYRRREQRHGVRVPWRAAIGAGGIGLLLLLALYAAPTGQPVAFGGEAQSVWQGFLTPLLTVGIAAFVLGLIERSVGIVLSGTWMALVAWQFCATGQIGGLFGWQVWLLSGGSGPALGGQLTLLGMDRPAPALLVMALPLSIVAAHRAWRARGLRK